MIDDFGNAVTGNVGNRPAGGLPPAPSPATLNAYLMPEIWPILSRVAGLVGETTPSDRVQEEIIAGSSGFMDDVISTLKQRGAVYGESVLLTFGEEGMLLLMIMKLMRALWSRNSGLPLTTRHDDYIDIAGYGVLILALDRYCVDQAKK